MSSAYDESTPLQNGAARGGSPKTKTLADCYDDEVRRGFIQKVFALVGLQCMFMTALTFAVAMWMDKAFPTNEPLAQQMAKMDPKFQAMFNFIFQWGAGISFVLYFVPYCMMMCCCTNLRRQVPWNYILLTLMTIGMSHIVAISCAQFQTRSVFLAFGVTSVICFACIAYAMNTKSDFTGYGMYLFVIFIGMMLLLLVLGLCSYCFPAITAHWQTIDYVFNICFVPLFACFLVYHVQLLLGDKQYGLQVDDYCFGAIIIFSDIVNLLLHIVQIMGDRR